MTAESRIPDLEGPLTEAIAAYLRAAEEGRPLERTEFLSRYPELASELKTFLENHDDLERLSRPLRDLLQVDQESWEGRHFGNFEIQTELGRGGMGVIHCAWHKGLKRKVAFKVIRAGRLATEEDQKRFRREAEAAAALSHPNIVPIYDYGEHDGQPYFTMELIEGHTLDGDDRDFRTAHPEAARLIALVARAIHHAHQRMIIHRDLKPSNILIDAGGAPRVTDFGLAMHVERQDRITSQNILIGTLPYMSPEQLSDKTQRLTTSVDIWSLGVILFELLTGKTPFQGRTEVETMDRIRHGVPTAMDALNPGVDRDLQAICSKCLEKEPERRYGSALGLALDLERCLRGEPIFARPVGTLSQLWSWCRRKPAIAGVVALSSMLFLFLATSLFMVSASKSARRREILDTNVHMAQGVATQMQLQFTSYSRPVLEAGAELSKLLLNPDKPDLQAFLERIRKTYPSPSFESWFIVEPPGVMVARSPYNGAVGRTVAPRDYWQGTLRHYDEGRGGRGVHLSLVYQSIATQVVHYALCIPILSENKLVGVLGATLSTDDTLGLPNLHDTRRKATLIGPYDPGRIEGDLEAPGNPIEWLVLVHEGLRPGKTALSVHDPMLKELGGRSCPRELSNPDATRLSLRNADYVDPYRERDGNYSGRWLAGYAPVGNTGFVVIVQQRED